MVNFDKKDRTDRELEARFGLKKMNETLESASYIFNGKVEDENGERVVMKRADLRYLRKSNCWLIQTYRPDSLCAYGQSHCATGFSDLEWNLFRKKIRKKRLIFRTFEFCRGVRAKFKRIGGDK